MKILATGLCLVILIIVLAIVYMIVAPAEVVYDRCSVVGVEYIPTRITLIHIGKSLMPITHPAHYDIQIKFVSGGSYTWRVSKATLSIGTTAKCDYRRTKLGTIRDFHWRT